MQPISNTTCVGNLETSIIGGFSVLDSQQYDVEVELVSHARGFFDNSVGSKVLPCRANHASDFGAREKADFHISRDQKIP